MDVMEQLEKGVLYAFIPDTLRIIDKPEINFFPLNVMFSKYKMENEQLISGTVVYIPDLLSLGQDGDVYTMTYYNQYSKKHWLIIEYNMAKQVYMGEKFVNGVKMFQTDAPDGKNFFIHFTMVGLSNGESCRFEVVENIENVV